jgi:hypothetical protein
LAGACSYTFVMADEDTVLEEAMDNLKEAGQRIRAAQSLMRSEGIPRGLSTLYSMEAMSATGDSTLEAPPRPRLAKLMHEPLFWAAAFERWRGTVGGS